MSDTIAEKLQTIAENVPKVYNAGKEHSAKEAVDTIETINKFLATLVDVE